MNIIHSLETGIVTIRPAALSEAEAIILMFENMRAGTRLDYAGRGNHPSKPEFHRLSFKHGKTRLDLYPETKEENTILGNLRDICFYWQGPSFVEADLNDDVLTVALRFARKCKYCGEWCTIRSRITNGVCIACVEKCQHEWEEGATHGDSTTVTGFGCGDICKKCGFVREPEPGERVLTEAEQHDRVVTAGYLDAIIYPPGSYVPGLSAPPAPPLPDKSE